SRWVSGSRVGSRTRSVVMKSLQSCRGSGTAPVGTRLPVLPRYRNRGGRRPAHGLRARERRRKRVESPEPYAERSPRQQSLVRRRISFPMDNGCTTKVIAGADGRLDRTPRKLVQRFPL